jgi:rubrerythrin
MVSYLHVNWGSNVFPNVVKSLFATEGSEVVRECRRCGETVSAEDENCPYCGPGVRLVEYEID